MVKLNEPLIIKNVRSVIQLAGFLLERDTELTFDFSLNTVKWFVTKYNTILQRLNLQISKIS